MWGYVNRLMPILAFRPRTMIALWGTNISLLNALVSLGVSRLIQFGILIIFVWHSLIFMNDDELDCAASINLSLPSL